MPSASGRGARVAALGAAVALVLLAAPASAPAFQVAPAFVSTTVAAGAVATLEFEFVGTKSPGVAGPVRDPLRLGVAEFVVTADGTLGYTAPAGWRNSAKPWVRLDGAPLAGLTSERALVVPVRIEPPSSAAPGTYFAALEIRPLDDPARANISMSPRAIAPILVEVPGTRVAVRAKASDPLLSIVDPPAPPTQGASGAQGTRETARPEALLSVTVSNESNFAVYPRVKATLRRDGRVLDVLPLDPRGARSPRLLSMVAPWGSRPFEARIRRPVAAGPCLVDLYVDLGPGGQFRTSAPLEVSAAVAEALRGTESSVLAADLAELAFRGDATTISSESIEVTNVGFDAVDVAVESSADWLRVEPSSIRGLASGASRRVRVRAVRPPTADAETLEARVRFVPSEGTPFEVPVRVRRLDAARAGAQGGR